MKTIARIFSLILCLLIFAGGAAAQSLREYYINLPINKQSLEEKLQFKPIAMPENIEDLIYEEVQYWEVEIWDGNIYKDEVYLSKTYYRDDLKSIIQFIEGSIMGKHHIISPNNPLLHRTDDTLVDVIPILYDGNRLLAVDSVWEPKSLIETIAYYLLTPIGKDKFEKMTNIESHPEASSKEAVVHNIPPRDIVKQIGLRPLPVDETLFSFEEYDQPNKQHKNIIYSTPNIRDTLYKVRYWRSGGPEGGCYTKWENGRVVIDTERILYFDWLGETYYEFDATKTYVKGYMVYPYGYRYEEFKQTLDSFTISAYDGKQIILSSSETNGAYIVNSLIPASQEEIEILRLNANRKPPLLKWRKRLIFEQIPHPACQPLTAKPIGKIELQQMESR
ncbi:MAG: hypothetical protein IKU22_03815 [Alistipes sp.]|nr:hypothetical protein [Alistipes sp.]